MKSFAPEVPGLGVPRHAFAYNIVPDGAYPASIIRGVKFFWRITFSRICPIGEG
jgi:hypothetical protein